MKLTDLKEMATPTEVSFEVTREWWSMQLQKLQNSKLVRRCDGRTELKQLEKTFSLWTDGLITAISIFYDLEIGGKSYLALRIIVSDPEKRSNGYATSLLWNLYNGQDQPIYIGGAISRPGQLLLKSFFKKLGFDGATDGGGLDMIDKSTGEVVPFEWKKFLSKNKLGLLLDSSHLDAKVTEDYGVWIFDAAHFEGTP
jgi:hypothetical protein